MIRSTSIRGPLLAVLAVVVVAATVSVTLWRQSRRHGVAQHPTAVVESHLHGVISTRCSAGAVSPNGQHLAFISPRSGDTAAMRDGATLWVSDIDAARPAVPCETRLRLFAGLSWDHASSRVAFAAWDKVRSTAHIGCHDLASGSMTTITERPLGGGDWFPRWHPDDDKIAFSRATGPGVLDVWLLDLNTGRVSELTHHGEVVRGLGGRWWPGRDEVLFIRRDGHDRWAGDLWTVNLSGEARRLTDGILLTRLVDVNAQSGRALCAATPRAGSTFSSSRLCIVDLAQGACTTVTESGGDAVLSPDGGMLAFCEKRSVTASQGSELTMRDISQGSEAVVSTNVSGMPWSGAWTPGGRVLFLRSGNRELWSMTTEVVD